MRRGQAAPARLALLVALLARASCVEERVGDGPALPPVHPPRVSTHNYGLPDKCLTYRQRYAGHEEAHRQDWAPNVSILHSKFVILVRLHSTLRGFKHDLFTSLRALVTEGTESGYHVYFLYQITNQRTTNMEEAMEGIPLDLRRFLVVFHEEMIVSMYNKIPGLLGSRGIIDETHRGAFNHPGPRAVYLPNVYFMHLFQKYDFCWVVEHDVRYIGHWGHMLNAALNLAMESPREFWIGDQYVYGRQEAAHVLPGRNQTIRQPLPDLVNFEVMRHEGNNWGYTRQGIDDETVTTGLQLYGGSRRLYNILHTYSMEGRSAYLEAFVPTVARRENLTMVAVGHPQFDEGRAKQRRHIKPEDASADDTWKCCSKLADRFYADWFRSGSCRHAVLLHPVKLDIM